MAVLLILVAVIHLTVAAEVEQVPLEVLVQHHKAVMVAQVHL